MKIDKVEVIGGIIEMILATFLYSKGYVHIGTLCYFCMMGGYHFGKGLWKEHE